MAKCPKCGEEIEVLDYQSFGSEGGTYYGKDDYKNRWDDHDRTEYLCPECSKVLFTMQDDADEFLSQKEPEGGEENG